MWQSFLSSIGNSLGLIFIGAFAFVVFLYKRQVSANARLTYESKQNKSDLESSALLNEIDTLDKKVKTDDKLRLENEAAIRTLIGDDK